MSELLHSIHSFPNANSLKEMISILEQLYIQEISILEKSPQSQEEIYEQRVNKDKDTSALTPAAKKQCQSIETMDYSECCSIGLLKEVSVQCDSTAASIRAYKEKIAMLECAIEFEKRNNEMEKEDAIKRDQEFLSKIANLEKELDVSKHILWLVHHFQCDIYST